MSEISVIVLSYNNANLTKQCVESIWTNTQAKIHVIVVDNNSHDEDVYKLLSSLDQESSTIIYNNTNTGFPVGMNIGIQEAIERGSDYIVIANNDTVFTPRSIDNLIDCLESDENIAIAVPSTNYAFSKQRIPQIGRYDSMSGMMTFAERFMLANAKTYESVSHVTGLCMAFKKEFVTEIADADGNFFDPCFGKGNFEDNDLCRRTLGAGKKLMICRDSYIHHYGSQSFKTDAGAYAKLLADNEEVFRGKWDRRQIITAMFAVKNEAKHLRQTLADIEPYVDHIVILDDGSTDDTVAICKSFAKVTQIVSNPPGLERDEGRDRNTLFKLAKSTNADWIIPLDGDEMLESEIKDNLQKLCNPLDPWLDAYCFKVATFWRGHEHIRIDGIWGNQRAVRMFRNRRHYQEFPNLKFHAPSIPVNMPRDRIFNSDLYLKHYGYCDYEEATRKYRFYMSQDKAMDKGMIGAADYSHLVDESRLELLDWVEDRKSHKKLSLCMIVKNEENNLRGCLESVAGLFDEIVVVDTGSTDKTVEIAESFGAKVYEFPWIDDFAAARNEAFAHATGDFIMWLDGDDRLDPKDHKRIRDLVNSTQYIGAFLPTKNVLKTGGTSDSNALIRIFRNHKGIKSLGRIHEDLKLPKNRKVIVTDIPVYHTGYQDESLKVVKTARNIYLLSKWVKDEPTNPRPHFFLARSYRQQGQWDLSIKHAKKYLKFECDTAPLRYTAMIDLAFCLNRIGKMGSAIDACYKAVAINNTMAAAHTLAGEIFFQKKLYEQAIVAFETSLRLNMPVFETNPVRPDEYRYIPAMNLGQINGIKGNIQRAIEYFSLALEQNQNDLHANRFLYEAHKQLGMAEAAQKFYNKWKNISSDKQRGFSSLVAVKELGGVESTAVASPT